MFFHGRDWLNNRPRVSLTRAPHGRQLHIAAGRVHRLILHRERRFLRLLLLFTDFGTARAPGQLWRSHYLGLFCCRLLCLGLFLESKLESKGVQGTAAGELGPRGWSRAFCAPRAWRAWCTPLLPFLLRRWQGRAHRVVPRRPVSVVFPSVFARGRRDNKIKRISCVFLWITAILELSSGLNI